MGKVGMLAAQQTLAIYASQFDYAVLHYTEYHTGALLTSTKLDTKAL